MTSTTPPADLSCGPAPQTPSNSPPAEAGQPAEVPTGHHQSAQQPDPLSVLVTLMVQDRQERARTGRWLVAGGTVLALLLAANVALMSYLTFDRTLRVPPEGAGTQTAAGQGPIYTPPQPAPPLVTTDTIRVGRSDDTNNFVVTVEGIQYRRDETRVWVTVENRGTADVQFMAGAKARLLDQDGHVYKVNPFAGDHEFWGAVPAGGKLTGWMSFPPIPKGTKQLTFEVDSVFTMDKAPWKVAIPFDVAS